MASEWYLIRKNAIPDVLLRVVDVNRYLASGECRTVGEAVRKAGISRSSYYKFKNDIEEFHEGIGETTLELSLLIHDEPGVLSDILQQIASCRANILTIHQSIPMNSVASVSISLQMQRNSENASHLLEGLQSLHGVRHVKVLGRQGL